MRNKTAKWVALYGMLISLAFIFSYIEAVIPIPIPVPGVKLGLANLVSIIGLYTVGISGTIAVSLVRIVLVGFTFGNLSSIQSGWWDSQPDPHDFIKENRKIQSDWCQHHWRYRT